MAKFRIARLEDRIVPSALCCVCDAGSDKSAKSNKSDKSEKCGSSKKAKSEKCGSSKKAKSEKCGSSKKAKSEKCAPVKGNNGYGNGGHDGSPNGKQDRTR
jgi:hypothetical protein